MLRRRLCQVLPIERIATRLTDPIVRIAARDLVAFDEGGDDGELALPDRTGEIRDEGRAEAERIGLRAQIEEDCLFDPAFA